MLEVHGRRVGNLKPRICPWTLFIVDVHRHVRVFSPYLRIIRKIQAKGTYFSGFVSNCPEYWFVCYMFAFSYHTCVCPPPLSFTNFQASSSSIDARSSHQNHSLYKGNYCRVISTTSCFSPHSDAVAQRVSTFRFYFQENYLIRRKALQQCFV